MGRVAPVLTLHVLGNAELYLGKQMMYWPATLNLSGSLVSFVRACLEQVCFDVWPSWVPFDGCSIQ